MDIKAWHRAYMPWPCCTYIGVLLGQVQRFNKLQLAFEQGWVLSSSEVDKLQDLASRMPQLMARLLLDVTHMCIALSVAE